MNRHYFLLSLMILNYCLSEDEYYTYDRIDSTLHAWQSDYSFSTHPIFPDNGIIYNLDTIGYSSQDSLPIFAVKLSDNANVDEDEARVLILGQCHAEEIYGVEISMSIIGCFLDPEQCWDDFENIRPYLLNILENSLEKIELWIVPTHNPEGLKVVHGYCNDDTSDIEDTCNGNWIEDPTYRKNIRDAVNFDTFDYVTGVGQDEDGVDLNRNYDVNWIFGDKFLEQTNSCNNNYNDDYDYYRGSAPFSEKEILAVRNLAIEKKYLLSIAYHSSRSGCVAEKVVFPWGWKDKGNSDNQRKISPDYSVIKHLGDKLHQILEFPSADFAVPQGSRTGNAHDWLYRDTGCIQYLIEVGEFNYGHGIGDEPINSYHDPEDALLIDNKYHETIEENLGAFFYLMIAASGENVSGLETIDLSQITGIVSDEQGNALIGANVAILEMDGLVLKPRITDDFGRFRRLLHPDSSYTLVVSAPGYITDTTAIESSELIVGINQFNIELESQLSYQLVLNIQTPSNDVEGVNLYYQDSFTHGILSNMVTFLPKDNYQIRLEAEGLSPVIINTYLDDNKTFNIQLNEENILFSDDFLDLSNWEEISEVWIISNNKLKSQADLFYNNNIQQQMISNIIPIEETGEYVVEVNLRYELEWENDLFSLKYVSDIGTVELLSLTGDKYDIHTEYIPLSIHEGQQNGQIFLGLETDYNLNYRGIEIDNLVVYKSGKYTSTDLSNLTHMLPDNFTLEQNYPNPFNPTTNINFYVPYLSPVSISIYNIQGKLIEELVDNIYKQGHYTVYIDAREYASGIYLYCLEAENAIYARKLIIIK